MLWYPKHIYSVDIMKNRNYVIIILNTVIRISPDILIGLWQNAKIRMTIDGGTNKWLNFIKENKISDNLKHPDIISGDFDSINEEASNYFSSELCKRIHTPCQDETDFTKGLKALKPFIKEKDIDEIIVIHDTSGRMDHIFANINTLFKSKTIFDNSVNLYLISYNSLTWLLDPGNHVITIPLNLYESKNWCSLIPVGEKTNVTTEGLKWNLNEQTIQFGGSISTSNTYSSQIITISTSNFLLWSMGIFDKTES